MAQIPYSTATQFQTTAAYLSGGICGSMWWPVGQLGGKPVNITLRGLHGGKWDRGDFDTFAECLDSILAEECGDFSGAQFTEDTIIRIERKALDGPYRYRVHVREIPLADVASLREYVRHNAYTGDFMGECD